MSDINNGGPAFPAMHFDLADNEHGMSLRDYFAASIDVRDVPISAYEALIGEFPDYADAITKQRWWANGEAAYRYHRADAMLKAREVQQ